MIRKFVKLGMPLALVLGSIIGLSAFEAHVVNVTAKIENALSVSAAELDFGTVFPQEHLNQPVTVSLSQSFQDEDRVDDVEYFIRQKPKCGVTDQNGTVLIGPTGTGHVFPGVAQNPGPSVVQFDPDGSLPAESGDEYYVDCGLDPREPVDQQVGSWGLLPSLCPYISKEDDNTPDNDGMLPSFHKPFQIINGQVLWTDTPGRLAKSDQDLSDLWTIDLAVPCFGGQCAQDWADFVHGINPDANPDDYTLDPKDEHKIFGCDLWFEVRNISLPPPPGEELAHLTVNKVVVNNNGGNNDTSSFNLFVGGVPVVNGVQADFPAGNYTVSETGGSGYEATFSGDCDISGDITLAAGQTYTCTITNDDLPAIITLVKSVVNDNGGSAVPSQFKMRVDGTLVPSGTSKQVSSNAAHVINEDAFAGYHFISMTGASECPGALGGGATLDEGESIVCTITNGDDGGAT